MEGERTETEAYDSPSVVQRPQIERRTSPSESIFGNPYEDEKYRQNAPASQPTMGLQVSDEMKVPQSSDPGETERIGGEVLVSYTIESNSAAYIGDNKRGHVQSVKLKDFGEVSEASDEPLISDPDPLVETGISEKNKRWQHPLNESDSLVVRNWVPEISRSSSRKVPLAAYETSGRSNMPPLPASVMAPSIVRVTAEKKKDRPLFDERALEHKSNKALQAFSFLALMHLICLLLFVANTYFVPIYYLQDNETGDEVGQITFQEIEIYCDQCDESSRLTSDSYLYVCGIDEANEDFTNGFISDYTTAAFLSFIAFVLAAGNIGIIFVLACFLLARKITDLIPQVIILIGGLVSFGELFVGLIVPLQTQLGKWNREKVNDIFTVSEFECESTIYVYSSFGFLLVWLSLGCVLVDMVLTQRLFSLVRML